MHDDDFKSMDERIDSHFKNMDLMMKVGAVLAIVILLVLIYVMILGVIWLQGQIL